MPLFIHCSEEDDLSGVVEMVRIKGNNLVTSVRVWLSSISRRISATS